MTNTNSWTAGNCSSYRVLTLLTDQCRYTKSMVITWELGMRAGRDIWTGMVTHVFERWEDSRRTVSSLFNCRPRHTNWSRTLKKPVLWWKTRLAHISQPISINIE